MVDGFSEIVVLDAPLTPISRFSAGLGLYCDLVLGASST
jgi:hypothetical protein